MTRPVRTGTARSPRRSGLDPSPGPTAVLGPDPKTLMAIVVPIGHLQRSLHLFPAFDTNRNNEVWSHYDVLEKCATFYVSPFSDRHAYHHFV